PSFRWQQYVIVVADVGCGEIVITAVEFVKEPPCHRQTRVRAVVASPELSRKRSSD
ncbi:hypothetical protein A2U01_0038103, partial [Trifolium medium]|nr:hypothetical protein [Trifolium medium]